MKIPLIFSKTAIYYAISWYTIPLYIPSIHGPVLVNADGWAQTALLNKINNIWPLQNGLVSQEFTVNMKHIETDMINQNRSILKDLPNCFCIKFFFIANFYISTIIWFAHYVTLRNYSRKFKMQWQIEKLKISTKPQKWINLSNCTPLSLYIYLEIPGFAHYVPLKICSGKFKMQRQIEKLKCGGLWCLGCFSNACV